MFFLKLSYSSSFSFGAGVYGIQQCIDLCNSLHNQHTKQLNDALKFPVLPYHNTILTTPRPLAITDFFIVFTVFPFPKYHIVEICMQVRKQQLELDMEQQTGSRQEKEYVKAVILSPCLFNLHAEYIMRNAGLKETQAGIKIAGRNINNLRNTN